MKKLFLIVLVLAAAVLATGPYTVGTEILSFANETAAKGDTLASSDSAFCVFYQTDKEGNMPEKVTLHLPDGILASGDSCLVYIRGLSSFNGSGADTANGFSISKTTVLPVNRTSSVISKGYSAGGVGPKDNVRVGRSTGVDRYKSNLLGAYDFTNGAIDLSWVPLTTCFAPRVELFFVESSGAPVITGMDTLGTSPISIDKIYKKEN